MGKIQPPFILKTQQKRNKREIPQPDTGHLWKTQSEHHTQKTMTFHQDQKDECLLSLHFCSLGVLARAIRQDKETKASRYERMK